MSSYGKPGFTAEGERPEHQGEFGAFGITLEDNRDEPRDDWDESYGAEFDLNFPHQCEAWSIAAGDRRHVLEAAYRFRAELDRAIGKLGGRGHARPTGWSASCQARTMPDPALLEAFRRQLRTAGPANHALVLTAWMSQPGADRDDLIDAYEQAEAAT